MNPSRLLPALLISLAISGGCTFMLAHALEARKVAPAVPDLHYLSCSRDLKAGELIKPDAVETVLWPGAHPIAGAITVPADAVGRAVLFPLAKGEPVLDRDLAAPGAGAGLAAKIPEGMRAIALRSDEVVGVAGFLTPGSRVDVIVTIHSLASPDPVSTIALEDAEVVAVGQRVQPDPEGKPNSVTVVTLLLTPEQAQRAVLASTQGSVHFVLRNGADRGHANVRPLLLSAFGGGAPLPPAAPAAPLAASASLLPLHRAPKADDTHQIEVVLGGGNSEPASKGDSSQP